MDLVQLRRCSSSMIETNSASKTQQFLPELLSKNLMCLSSCAVIVTGSVGWHTIRFTWLLIGYSDTTTTIRKQLLHFSQIHSNTQSSTSHMIVTTVFFNQSNSWFINCRSKKLPWPHVSKNQTKRPILKYNNNSHNTTKPQWQILKQQ